MGWDQLWSWMGIVSGWFGHKEKKRRVSQLQVDSSGSQSEVKGSANITGGFYKNSPVTINYNPPPDRGDVNTTKVMTQSEYDALPSKDEQTLYLIVNRD